MNWRFGLRRFWIVLSAIWLIVSAAIAFVIWNGDADARFAADRRARWEADCGGQKRGPGCDVRPAPGRPLPWATYPGIVLGPPLLVFALGCAGLWVVRGFRSTT